MKLQVAHNVRNLLTTSASQEILSIELVYTQHISTCLMTKHVVWTGNWIYCARETLTTINYSAIVNSQTLQFTTARIKASQSAVS
jgi:hypothetical protein